MTAPPPLRRARPGNASAGWARVMLAGLVGAVVGCGGDPLPAFRHVVVISLDTTRADHLECYGGATVGGELVRTPRLAEFAAESVVFSDVTAPAPTTLASHVSMMTGLAPRSHGVPRNGFVIPRDNTLLAQHLKAAGYRTAAFLGSFALDHHFGFHRGFDVFDRAFDLMLDGRSFDQNQRRAESVTDAVLTHLDETQADRRFLFVHYFDAHNPYDPPAPYDRMYARPDGPASADLSDLSRSIARHHAKAGVRPLSQAALFEQGLPEALVRADSAGPLGADSDIAALYAGEISYLDHHVGRLLDGLEQRGILDDALVVVTGDHGETFWEHGDTWNHGLWVYDTTVRVPLIVRLPGGHGGGRTVAEPVSTIDLVPTLVELAHLDVDGPFDGRSLVAALGGETLSDVPIVSEATQPAGAIERNVAWRNEHKPKALRLGRWKYVSAPYLELEQLFDLHADPGETTDLLASPSAEALDVRAELRAALEHWSADRKPPLAHFSSEANAEVATRLRSLGYLGGAPQNDSEDD